MDAIATLCDVRRSLEQTAVALSAGADRAEIAGELRRLAEIIDGACIQGSLTIEAFNPVLDEEHRRSGELNVLDLCYNAFMIGRQQENRENGARTAYFDDCHPLMLAGVERILKETRKRVEYAADERRRCITRNVEKTECTLPPDKIDAGAACLYGHLDQSFSGGDRVSYPQASAHTRGKYQRAFASAVAAAERVREAA